MSAYYRMAQSQKGNKERLLTNIKEIFQVNNGIAPESLKIYYSTNKFCKCGTVHYISIREISVKANIDSNNAQLKIAFSLQITGWYFVDTAIRFKWKIYFDGFPFTISISF